MSMELHHQQTEEMQHQQYAYDLVKNFHEQFAQNYNSHLTLFGTLLGYLGLVIVAYGYVFNEFIAKRGNNYYDSAFNAAFLGATLLLFLGATLVLILASGYRRDQAVVATIRKEMKIVQGQEGAIVPVFPQNFDPKDNIREGKGAWLLWVPDIYLVLYVPFVFFELLLVVFHTQVCPGNFSSGLVLSIGYTFSLGVFVLPRLMFIKLRQKILGKAHTPKLTRLSRL